MRRLKTMSEEIDVPRDPFGTDYLQDKLKVFCKEQGLDMPRFWVFPPKGVYMCYAVSLHLKGKDKGEVLDANTIFMLKSLNEIGNIDALENRLNCIMVDLGEPIILTIKADETLGQQQLFKGIGLIKMPVTWSDNNQNVYEVYVKGKLEMGCFVMLMEHVEHLGREIVYEEYQLELQKDT